jgi:TonB family protein
MVRGSLNKEIIKRLIARHRNEVRACYETALQKDHALSGRVELQLTIAPSGRVTAADIGKSDLGGDVGACIAHAARRWEFPRAEGGGGTIITYPYRFTPAAPPPRAPAKTEDDQ